MIHSSLKKENLPIILIQIWHVSLKGTFNRCAPVAHLVTCTVYHRTGWILARALSCMPSCHPHLQLSLSTKSKC